VRRGGFWAKHMGLKSSAIGNVFGGHIELREQFGEMVGTHQQLKKKKPLPPYPHNPN
jgi:hypothetical protein